MERYISEKQLEDAIRLIYNVVHKAVVQRQFKGISLRMPQLDRGLIRIAKLLGSEFKSAAKPRNGHCCLVTEIYKTGGHGAILNSVCEEIPSHVIFTDIFGRISDGQVELNGLVSAKALSSITLSPGCFTEKVRNCVNLMNTLSPKRVWLFSHHQDVVALLSALIFDEGQRAIFVHHCDHEPSLGATIKFPFHLDFTDELLQNCGSIGLEPSLLPLHCRAAQRRTSHDGGDIVVATAGSFPKFTGTLRGMQYWDVVKTVLQHPKVKAFHHIGQVPEAYVSEFRTYIASCGIDPGRILFAGQVPCVSDYMLSEGAQVYLSSFPVGAGTTSAEVQSAGIPIIYFDPNQEDIPLCSISSIYASPQLEWRQLKDIHLVLNRVAYNWKIYSDMAHDKYAESFSKQVFLNQIAKLR